MKKRFLCLTLALLIALLSLFGCASKSTASFKIAVLKGPTGFGAIKLLDDSKNGNTENTYDFTIESASDAVTSALLSKQLDIAFLPSNAAAMLYNKTEGEVSVIGVATLGILYIVSRDENVSSLADLEGKKVVTSGAGSTAEYATSYLFENNGLKIGENVTLDYASEHSEAASKLLSEEYDIAILPEPFVTMVTLQDDSLKTAVSLTDEWTKLNAGKLPMAAIAVRTELLKGNSAAIDTFLKEYAASADYVSKNPAEASELIEKYDIMKAPAAKNAIPNCNIVCETGEEMKEDLISLYEILFDANPKSIGGKMPGDDFYYIAK